MKSIIKSLLLFRQQKNSLPQTFIFFVTSRCNARCDFCLYYEQIENPVAREKELKIPEIETIARKYGKLHYLALSGGEPFVRKDLEPLCQAFIDHCGTCVVDIPSNFFYTNTMVTAMEPLARKNPDVIFDLQMSIDHIGQMHDESRKVRNLYRTAINSFQALSEIRDKHRNLKLKINIVYLDRNRDSIDDIVSELSRTVGFDRIQLTYPHKLIPLSSKPNHSEIREVEDYIAAANRVGRHSSRRRLSDLHSLGMRSVKGIYLRLLRESVSNKRIVGSYCEAGRNILVMNEKGDVFPCEPLWKAVGNLRDHNYDMKGVLNSPAYTDFRSQYLGPPGKCNCTWSCAIHSRISVQPSYLPRIVLNAARIVFSDLRHRGK